ncbi:MAG: FAD-dependent oxidoreductase, partial [Alphaproteobacteria bacterium]|nr:FAD-dependent oxidoreductase [Alphaproteobacteria bacterium]
ALAYLEAIGSVGSFWSPDRAAYPFVDIGTGERWTVVPNRGAFPRWIFDRSARVAGTSPWHYLSALRLRFAGRRHTVGQCLATTNPLYARFWEPLCVAALNTNPEEASAAILWRVVEETFAAGSDGCIPMVAREGLGPALVDPALATLRNLGAAVHFNTRARAIEFEGGRATGLSFVGAHVGEVAVGADDMVLCAVPPLAAQALLPDLVVPQLSRAIVNAHFRVARPLTQSGEVEFLGLVGGTANWLFLRGDIVSVTVSAADDLAELDNRAVEAALWRDTGAALGLADNDLVAARIIKEKRATFAQTPAQVAMRPTARTKWKNLALAGDWTDTGLPASIEGTIRSANTAVGVLTGR